MSKTHEDPQHALREHVTYLLEGGGATPQF